MRTATAFIIDGLWGRRFPVAHEVQVRRLRRPVVGYPVDVGSELVELLDRTDDVGKSAAIAGYNFELSVVNAQVVIGSDADEEQAAAVEAAVAKVAEKYQAWRTSTCS
jgi:hypothetical protein